MKANETQEKLEERAAKRVEEVLALNFNYFQKELVPPAIVMSAGLSMAATAAHVTGLDQQTFMKLCRGMFDAAEGRIYK